MSSFSRSHSTCNSVNDVTSCVNESSERIFDKKSDRRKYATLGKCTNFEKNDFRQSISDMKLSVFNCLPRLKKRSNSTQVLRCQSDAADTMRTQQKAINRNGTISRNYFRGVHRNVVERQTQQFILSMTVSKRFTSAK